MSDRYIKPGGPRNGVERWEALFLAALAQPNPTPELKAALEGLKVRSRGRTVEEIQAARERRGGQCSI